MWCKSKDSAAPFDALRHVDNPEPRKITHRTPHQRSPHQDHLLPTAEGTANVLVDQYIPLWGCPVSLLSDNGLRFTSQLSAAILARLGVRKISTSAYHPNGNGGVE